MNRLDLIFNLIRMFDELTRKKNLWKICRLLSRKRFTTLNPDEWKNEKKHRVKVKKRSCLHCSNQHIETLLLSQISLV